MFRAFLIAGAIAIGAGAVVAQTNVIKERQDAMKSLGASMKSPTAFLKGSEPFNLAAVQATLKTFVDVAAKSPALFPAGSNQGETAAAPKIWEAKADFDAKFKAMGEAAQKALVDIKDEATFKTVFPEVAKACGGCHTDYRLKKG